MNSRNALYFFSLTLFERTASSPSMASNYLLLLTILPVVLSESFRDSPASITALTHSPLNLTCYAPDPSPPPSIIWLVNSHIFQTNDSRRNVVYDILTGRSTFQLFEVQYSDAGQYQCIAISDIGTELYQSNVGTLTVQGQPSFRQPLSPVITPAGNQAVFQCNVISNPPATVSWTYGTPQQNLSNGGRIFFNSSTLIISNVQSSDEGYYHCIAQNSFGVNSTSAALTIGAPSPPLELTISPNGNPLQCVEGSDLTLHCQVNEDADTLHWYHNGVEVTQQLTRESNGLALSLEDITVEDGGEYSCIATSGSSVITQIVQLDVLIPPTVELTPSTGELVVVNYTLSLTPQCNASGIPQPTISWLGPNGLPLVIENGVPVFGPLSRASSGVYVCVATNIAGEERAELNLIVEDSPLITIPPSDTLAAYGSDVILTCSAEGNPLPVITWSRRNSDSLGNSAVEVTGALHLFSVAIEDSGVYICNASNGYDPVASVSATLTVLNAPRVTSLDVLPSSTILTGTDFTIECLVPNPPAPISINWYQDGTLLTQSGDPHIQIVTEAESGILTVYTADESYSGTYTCNATTNYAFDTAQVTVIVGFAPVIIVAPSDVDLKPGQGTFIDCVVSESPNPRIEWFFTNEMGFKSQLTSTVGDHYVIHTVKLELRNVTQQNSGVYECEVENELGRDFRGALVRVEGLPLPLSFSPTTLIADDNYTLTCDIIYNFPMATITWRRTDSTPLPEDRFITTTTGELNITSVDPSDAGGYECIASNVYGTATVAEVVIVHVRPSVTLPSSSLIAILFDNVTLSCFIDGSPTPTQQWSRTDRLPLIGSRYDYEDVTGDLTISQIRVTDTANYTCTATNEVGVASAVLEVIVKGAPVTNLTAVVLNSTVISISWSHPPTLLTVTLSAYHILYGFTSSLQKEALQVDKIMTFVLFTDLEEASEYEFIVFGDYDNVFGVEVLVTATTDEDSPTGAPLNVSLDGEVEALDISWLPPRESDRNGIIIRYDIYYRQTDDGEGEGNSTTDPRPFFKADHTPSNPLALSHSTRLGGLKGGQRYEVMISAATSVGVGPNSTLVAAETLEPFPLLLVLAIAIPAITLLQLFFLLVAVCVCYRCHYLRSRAGKHSPLREEEQQLWRGEQTRKGRRRKERIISDPMPEIPPNIETTAGKFAMKTQHGDLLSSHPKVIMPEDRVPPPEEGNMVQQVPHDEVLTSLKRQPEYNPYEEIGVGEPPFNGSNHQHPLSTDLQPNIKSNPLYRPEDNDGPAEIWANPRLTHSDEQIGPIGNQVNPNDYGSQPDTSIMLQGGSLPHMAHPQLTTEPVLVCLEEKSQSLDMNASMWSGLPLIREAETEASDNDGEEGDEREVRENTRREGWEEEALPEEGEGKDEEVREKGEDSAHEHQIEAENREEEFVEEEGHEWIQVQGDGWTEQLITETEDGRQTWEGHTVREAEIEVEEEEGEGEEEVGGRVTEEGWQEQYVGEEGEEPEITVAPFGQTEDDLRASNNALDLASQEAEPVVPETEDDTQNLYATIPESHKAKKRLNMMKEAQKRERNARKEKLKIEERQEKQRRKERERERKAREKQRKKGSKLQDEMALANTMRLHEVDTSTEEGRAKAQFIDAATAAIF